MESRIPSATKELTYVYNYQSTQPFIVNYAFTATCFDSTESLLGYLRNIFRVYKVTVHNWDPKGLQQQVLVYNLILVVVNLWDYSKQTNNQHKLKFFF
jgi:hypothetical protein